MSTSPPRGTRCPGFSVSLRPVCPSRSSARSITPCRARTRTSATTSLRFDLSKESPAIPACALIRLAAKARADLVFEVAPERLTIQGVRARGLPAPFHVTGDRLHVHAPGATEIDIRCTVRPTEDPNGYGLIRDPRTGTYSTFTWPYHTGALFPSNSSPEDGVTARVRVKPGPGQHVIGAGTVGKRPIHIDERVPAYAIAFYAGRFTREKPVVSKSGVTVTVHGHVTSVRREVRRAYQKATAAAIDFFSGWLGPYPYGNHLALVEVGGNLGGMENAGAVALMVGAIQGHKEAREMAVHETAHHWFGDSVRIRNGGEFWMSEGFTNYLTYRFFQHSDGDRVFYKLLDRARQRVKDALRHREHELEAPSYYDVREVFTDIPYETRAVDPAHDGDRPRRVASTRCSPRGTGGIGSRRSIRRSFSCSRSARRAATSRRCSTRGAGSTRPCVPRREHDGWRPCACRSPGAHGRPRGPPAPAGRRGRAQGEEGPHDRSAPPSEHRCRLSRGAPALGSGASCPRPRRIGSFIDAARPPRSTRHAFSRRTAQRSDWASARRRRR